MKYFSEIDIIKEGWANKAQLDRSRAQTINVRLCRECEYFEYESPTEKNFGYCTYRTDFMVLDDEPINWYFTNINGFCNEDEINEVSQFYYFYFYYYISNLA